jgi:hypothetical protein
VKRVGEDTKVAVPGAPKARAVTGTMIAAFAFLVCISEANIIPYFGTHIFMGPLWLVLRTSDFFCLLGSVEGLELS